MSTTSFPSTWKIDDSLESFIPSPHDYRTFIRLTEAQGRYALCINGGGIYDLKRACFLKPQRDKASGRVRYRLNLSDPAQGKRNAILKPFYARLILTAVLGPRGRKFQAHHSNNQKSDDRWDNLQWVTGKANKRLAAQHASRAGTSNPNSMSIHRLSALIQAYDDEKRICGAVRVKKLAERFSVSPRQIRRLAAEQSSADDVRKIRKKLQARAYIPQSYSEIAPVRYTTN